MYKTVKNYLLLVRPVQWLKNLLLLFPPFFGGSVAAPGVLAVLAPAFISFSLAASCTYIINDIRDRHTDRTHVKKKERAIARGAVKVWHAAVLAGVLYVTAMLLASAVSERFVAYLVIYLLISVFYTLYFKRMILVDIFALSSGYLLRVVAGGEAFRVPVSHWLFLTVFVVAIFLAAGKRLGELILSERSDRENTGSKLYPLSFLEGILWFSASCALVTYALYVIDKRGSMLYTVPLIAFGLLRYIFIAKQGRGDPTEVLLSDGQIMGAGVLWTIMIGLIIYQ